MSTMGTGPAAGVAQTALTAQQTARTRDREKNRRAAETRDLRESVDTHVQAIDEGDEDGMPTQLHVEGELPQHLPPQQFDPDEQRRVDIVDTEVETEEESGDAPTGALYRHIDLQA